MFNYYTDTDREHFQYYNYPIALNRNPIYYEHLSAESRILYCAMRNRVNLSMQHPDTFRDEKGRYFIYYTLNEIIEELHCGKTSAVKYLNELKSVELVDTVKQGFGLPQRVYLSKVQDVEVERKETKKRIYAENRRGSESETLGFENANLRGSESETLEVQNVNLCGSESEPLVVQNVNPKNNTISNNYKNNIDNKNITSISPSLNPVIAERTSHEEEDRASDREIERKYYYNNFLFDFEELEVELDEQLGMEYFDDKQIATAEAIKAVCLEVITADSTAKYKVGDNRVSRDALIRQIKKLDYETMELLIRDFGIANNDGDGVSNKRRYLTAMISNADINTRFSEAANTAREFGTYVGSTTKRRKEDDWE